MSMDRKKINDLSRAELVALLDQQDGPHILLGIGFLQEEIFRRDCQTQNEELGRMTTQIRTMTAIMAVLTLIVTVATIALLLRE